MSNSDVCLSHKNWRSFNVCIGHVHIVKDLEEMAGLVRRNLSNKSKSAGDERSDPKTFVPPTDFIPPISFIPRLASPRIAKTLGPENVRCRDDVLAATYVREKEEKKEKKGGGRAATKTTEVSLSG